MDNELAEAQAARRLIAGIDLYEQKFQAMVDANMQASLYEEVSQAMAVIRDAKLVLFWRISRESMEFLLAHSALMGTLWDIHLSRARGMVSTAARALAAHTLDHEHAIEVLRAACERVLSQASRTSHKPPAAPSVGY